MTLVLSRRFLVALLVALLAGLLFSASYFQENAEAYLFPSIVSGIMLVLSVASLVREAFNMCVDDFESFPFVRQLPALVMMGGAVALAEPLGMYSSAFLVLMAVSYWYSPVASVGKRLRNSFLFSTGFVAAMYLLFSVLLSVQTPRGILL